MTQVPRERPVESLTARARSARANILAAAAALLAADGEIDVSRVAARAGVSEGLPYRYFGSRSGLIAAVIEDFHQRLAEAVVYADFPGETWQRREKARVFAWVRFLYRDPLSPIVLGGLGGDPIVAASWQRALSRAVDAGSRNFTHAQQAGDLPRGNDPVLLAAAVLGGVHAAVATALQHDPRPPEDLVQHALWTFVRGASEATS